MLYIILSSEYKSSWRKTPVSGVLHDDWSQSTECGRVQLNAALKQKKKKEGKKKGTWPVLLKQALQPSSYTFEVDHGL